MAQRLRLGVRLSVLFLTGALTVSASAIAQMQIEGKELNVWVQTAKSGKILVLRKGKMSGLSSGLGDSQKPIFVVNYRTNAAGQKAKMIQEATDLIPLLKADLADGYSEVMICPYVDKDTGASPLEMFIFEQDKKHLWKKAK